MTQDSEDWDDLFWEIDNFQSSPRPINTISSYSEAGSSKSKTIDKLLEMQFDEEAVIKAIRVYGEDNVEQIANALLSSAAEKSPIVIEDEDIDGTESDDEMKYSNFLSSDDEKDTDSNQLRTLRVMGFSEREASLALERCGKNVSIVELADFIFAAQISRESAEFHSDLEEQKPIHDAKKRRIESTRASMSFTENEPVRLPNPMIGFGLPNGPRLIRERSIPSLALGPPFFYYENVALAPKGVWQTISRHLYEIRPEFFDSRHICATARKRGYIHNLPITNRFQVQPPPKYTIQDALPHTRTCWPKWDKRTKLNCIVTSTASAKVTERIFEALEAHRGEPSEDTKRFVMKQCKKWNLVWVGQNRVAPLDADEIEELLGFPRNHTRGGISRTERIRSLGNSFQVDTVAYHLSVLKPMFTTGINVLSLFSGIGGAEVALHRLQIPMKTVVSVEISQANRNILKDFWQQTDQKGVLIEFSDVQDLTNDKIVELMKRFGGFDLVIGGSPCNNLAGGNRVSRTGLEGGQSSLFYDFCRILDVVRETTVQMRM